MTRAFLVSAFLISACSLWIMATTAYAAPRILKGPYLMAPGPTTMTLMVELDQPSPLTVEIAVGNTTRKIESPRQLDHEIVIDALDPATQYSCRLVMDGNDAERVTFRTLPTAEERTARLLVYGDNRDGLDTHAALIRAMANGDADVVVHTGDMVARGTEPADWLAFFREAGPLLRRIPLLPTLGNHELARGGEGLRAYQHHVHVPPGGADDETYYASTVSHVRLLFLDSNAAWADAAGSGEDAQRASAQLTWAERELRTARASDSIEFVIVVVHHGPFSSGHHGGHEGLHQAGLVALLQRYEVDLVLSGHDHDYERGEAAGIKYIVTGGGGAPLYPENDALPSQLAFEASHHYVELAISDARADITVTRLDGSLLERCSFARREPFACVGHGDGRGPVENDTARTIVFVASRPVLWPLWALLGLTTAGIGFWWVRRRRQ